MEYSTIPELIGKTFNSVYTNKSEDEFYFVDSSNPNAGYYFYHSQDCCESVSIEDICGDLDDLVGEPLLVAEECFSKNPEDCEYGVWTFYRFSTIKGTVTIRWYGTSNGYYSVGVSLGEFFI